METPDDLAIHQGQHIGEDRLFYRVMWAVFVSLLVGAWLWG